MLDRRVHIRVHCIESLRLPKTVIPKRFILIKFRMVFAHVEPSQSHSSKTWLNRVEVIPYEFVVSKKPQCVIHCPSLARARKGSFTCPELL